MEMREFPPVPQLVIHLLFEYNCSGLVAKEKRHSHVTENDLVVGILQVKTRHT